MFWLRTIMVLLTVFVLFGGSVYYNMFLTSPDNYKRFYHKNTIRKFWKWSLPGVLTFIVLLLAMVWTEAQGMTGLYNVLRPLVFAYFILAAMFGSMSAIGAVLRLFFNLPKKLTFILIVIATIVYATVGYVNGQRLVVKDLTLPAENITRPYSFAHITDLHAGSTDLRYAQRVVDRITMLDPEFVVITGDFFDEYFVEPKDIAPFNELSMPVYLVTGNHEHYLPQGSIDRILDGSSINLIDHKRVAFDELDIIGVSELSTVDLTLQKINGVNPDRYSIILDHQPITNEVHMAASSGIHLMLSGHTHRGQIWPMQYLVQLQFWYVGGLYEIEQMFLYVNQGTGTLGPKIRVGTVNEITHITLEPSVELEAFVESEPSMESE